MRKGTWAFFLDLTFLDADWLGQVNSNHMGINLPSSPAFVVVVVVVVVVVLKTKLAGSQVIFVACLSMKLTFLFSE